MLRLLVVLIGAVVVLPAMAAEPIDLADPGMMEWSGEETGQVYVDGDLKMTLTVSGDESERVATLKVEKPGVAPAEVSAMGAGTGYGQVGIFPFDENGGRTVVFAVYAGGAHCCMQIVSVTETANGFVTVYPTGATRPTVSNLNVERADQTVPNLVTVRLGANGKVSLFSQTTTHLVADVAGYYVGSTATSDGRFHGITPTRILDTRAGIGAPAGLVPQGGRVRLQVGGIDPVPATGVSAVVLNATATEAELKKFLADKISKIEMPREIIFKDALPKTLIGKLSKKELRDEYAQRKEAKREPA